MRVLVTGSSGYIGTVLAQTLGRRSVQVSGLDSGLFDATLSAEARAAIPVLRKDVRDVTVAELQPFDTVVHLAGIPDRAVSVVRQQALYDLGYRATVRLASLSKFAGVSKFIYLSCAGMDQQPGVPLQAHTSSRSLQHADGYQRKVETDVARLADVRFSPTFLRAPAAYGPSGNFRADSLVNWLMVRACATGVIPLPEADNRRLSALFIQDLAEALASIIMSDRHETHSQTLCVHHASSNISLYDLADRIADCVPGSVVEFGHELPQTVLYSRIGVSRHAMGKPLWKPGCSLEDGLMALKAFVTEHMQEAPAFSADTYSRTTTLHHLLESGRLSSDLRWQAERAGVS